MLNDWMASSVDLLNLIINNTLGQNFTWIMVFFGLVILTFSIMRGRRL